MIAVCVFKVWKSEDSAGDTHSNWSSFPFQLNADEYILSQAYNETSLFLETGAEQTYLLPEMCLDVKSRITSFRMYAVNNGDVIFQVWRPISEPQQSEYMLVASHSYGINTAPGFFKVCQ